MANTKDFKQFVRSKYAWPGGYPLYAIMRDGGCLCHDCAKANAKLVIANTRLHKDHFAYGDRDWDCIAIDVNYENADLYCDNCSKRIESAYAED